MALECIRYSITSQSREGIVQLGSALGWPHLEFWGWFWMPQYNRDLKFLDSVQSGAVEMVRCLEGKPYEEWLMSLCSAWRRGHWGGTSLQSATSSWGREEGKTLISSPWWPVAGPGETQWSCVRGGLDIKKSFYIQWMIGTPEKWAQHKSDRVQGTLGQYFQAYGVGILILYRAGLNDPCGCLGTPAIRWFSSH